jgi:hypothetical protein
VRVFVLVDGVISSYSMAGSVAFRKKKGRTGDAT